MKFKVFDKVRLSNKAGEWVASGIITETNDEYSIVDFIFQSAKVKNEHLSPMPEPKGILNIKSEYSQEELAKLKEAWDVVLSKSNGVETPILDDDAR